MSRRLDGVEKVEQEERAENAAQPEGGTGALLALGIER